MELTSLLEFYERHMWEILGAGTLILAILVILILTSPKKNPFKGGKLPRHPVMKEGFETKLPDPPEPPKVRKFTTESCPVVKEAIRGYEIYIEEMKKREVVEGALKGGEDAIKLFQDMYTKLGCAEYLDKLAKGEIEQPQTPADAKLEYVDKDFNGSRPPGMS